VVRPPAESHGRSAGMKAVMQNVHLIGSMAYTDARGRESSDAAALRFVDLWKRFGREQRRLARVPGWGLHRFASWWCSKRVLREILEPVLSGLQLDYYEALAAGQPGKARWVR